MPTSQSLWLTCAVLLTVVPVAASSADARVGAAADVPTVRSGPAGNHAPSTGQYASEVPLAEQKGRRAGDTTPLTVTGGGKDGSIEVADEAAFVRENRFRTDGGYDATLKRAARVDYYGTRYVDCEHYRLEIHTARPDQVGTLLKEQGASVFESHREGKRIAMRGQTQGLPDEVERALLETFDFDTPVIDLESKHPTIQPIGMEKLPGILTWKFQTARSGEYYRVLYVDSHYGDVVKYAIFKADGAPLLDATLHDYRAVQGIRVPFAIDYLSPDGKVLANDRLQRVEVTWARS